MQDNIPGTPYIMEGHNVVSEYVSWNARFAVYTGLPSVIGWHNHQRQQRTLFDMNTLVNQRGANIVDFYNTADIDLAAEMLWHYDISYLVVGELEYVLGTPEGIAKLHGNHRACRETGLTSKSAASSWPGDSSGTI